MASAIRKRRRTQLRRSNTTTWIEVASQLGQGTAFSITLPMLGRDGAASNDCGSGDIDRVLESA